MVDSLTMSHSIRKIQNNVGRMKIYIWGTLLTGLPPLIWGCYDHYEDLMKHINGTGYRRTILGYPRAIVIYGFILCFGEVSFCYIFSYVYEYLRRYFLVDLPKAED